MRRNHADIGGSQQNGFLAGCLDEKDTAFVYTLYCFSVLSVLLQSAVSFACALLSERAASPCRSIFWLSYTPIPLARPGSGKSESARASLLFTKFSTGPKGSHFEMV